MRRTLTLTAIGVISALPSALLAHAHSIDNKRNQVIANGMNHPAFEGAVGEKMSCEDNTLPADFGPAWFGLETAHHGPDASGQGKGDGCYMLDGGILPGQDTDTNPAFN